MKFQKRKILTLFLLSVTSFFITNCNNRMKENPQQQAEEKKEATASISISGKWSITGIIGKDGKTEKPPVGAETIFTFKNDSSYDVSFKKNNVQGPGYSGTYSIKEDSVLHTHYLIAEESIHDQAKIILLEDATMHLKDLNAAGDIMIFEKVK